MTGTRAALCPLLLVFGAACGSPPPSATLGLVTTRSVPRQVTVLERSVEGQWCFTQNAITSTLRPPWRARLSDHGRAIEDAIAGVPGANVLTHVTVKARVEQYLFFQRICAIAVGNAGRLE